MQKQCRARKNTDKLLISNAGPEKHNLPTQLINIYYYDIKNPIHESELILSMSILIHSEGTCYGHLLYSIDAAILSAVD